jgi:GTP-binding protein
VLIDCRHEPQQIDVEFMRWLGESGIPFSIVFTKTDKLSQSRLAANIENYKNELLKEWETLPPMFATSSEKAQGRDELLNYIEDIMRQVNEEEKSF